MLTGKAKKEFNEWRFDVLKDNRSLYVPIHNTRLMHTLIIEWLDSVGIYIELGATCLNGQPEFDFNIQEANTINGMNGHIFNTRQEATRAAIEQANKIYNER